MDVILPTRRPVANVASSLWPFLVTGAVAIVAGGLAAAVTGPTDWDDGSWVAAFLVLVLGVGQIGLGIGRSALVDEAAGGRRAVIELVLFNGGSAFVIAGTLVDAPVVVTIGGVVIAAVLATLAITAWRSRAGPLWARRVYVGLLVVLLISTPVGLLLSWRRA